MADRPERVPAEEVRQRMLDAGRQLAHEVGAALTIEHLRLEEVIQRARVARSSVYRLWPYREDYIDDLLCYLAGEGSWFSDRTVLDPETFDLAVRVVTDNQPMLATPEGRRALMCEVVRITATRNYEVLTESLPWRLHMALIATLGSTRGGGARRRIAAALEDSQRRSRASLVAVLRHLADRARVPAARPRLHARPRAAGRRAAHPVNGPAQRPGPDGARALRRCRRGGPTRPKTTWPSPLGWPACSTTPFPGPASTASPPSGRSPPSPTWA